MLSLVFVGPEVFDQLTKINNSCFVVFDFHTDCSVEQVIIKKVTFIRWRNFFFNCGLVLKVLIAIYFRSSLLVRFSSGE